MTPAELPPPVIVRAPGWMYLFFGVIATFIAIITSKVLYGGFRSGEDIPLVAFALFSAVACGLSILAFNMFGMGLKRPVILRMDRDGISGFKVPPVIWQDVEKVGSHMDESLCYLGFVFKYPPNVFGEQNFWQKSSNTHGIHGSGYDLLVPIGGQSSHNARKILAASEAFFEAARSEVT